MNVLNDVESAAVAYGRPSTIRSYHWLRVTMARGLVFFPAFVAFIVMLAVWESVTAFIHLVPGYLLPAPSDIVEDMGGQMGYLLAQTWVTATEILLGYLAGMLIGLSLALMIFYSRLMERVVYPFVLATQYMPKLAIAPLIIVWFGLDIGPKVLVTALICLFPIMINTLVGLRVSDPQALELMHILNASRRQVFWMIRLPAASPHIFAGLKLGITLATTGAVVSEWISADSGLGYLIVFSLGYFHTTTLFAALVMLTCLGLFLFMLVVLAERLLAPHQRHLDISERTA